MRLSCLNFPVTIGMKTMQSRLLRDPWQLTRKSFQQKFSILGASVLDPHDTLLKLLGHYSRHRVECGEPDSLAVG